MEVTDDVKALQCDLCLGWEHRGCIRECDRPSQELYAALVSSQCKAILFVCAKCRRKGDVARRLFQLESESERASERCQSTELLLCERQTLVEMLQVDKGALQKEIIKLHSTVDELRRKVEVARLIDESASLPELLGFGAREPLPETAGDEVRSKQQTNKARTSRAKQISAANAIARQESSVVGNTLQGKMDAELSGSDSQVVSSDELSQSSDIDEDEVAAVAQDPIHIQAQATQHQRNVFSYPPGFKQIQERVGRFTGKYGDEDFEVWLADFYEATADCRWTDKQRAQWFSWFLSGAAKNTWQRALHKEEKKSWSDIVRIYKGHYGVHMEPRTAYLRCHELRYEDFLSVKGLLESMKDYQRMALDQLSDDNLLSILWNKAPYRLQKEVGDIKDWSLQELFERLLRAEARIAEHDRRVKTEPTKRTQRTVMKDENNIEANVTQKRPSSGRQNHHGSVEMQLKNIKCFKCHKKGHVAKDCSQTVNSTRVIAAEETTSDEECWIHVRVLTTESTLEQTAVSNTGPTYKANVVVEGLKSRALLDNGSQISLVRTEMLPKLKEINNWSMEECKSKTSKMVSQPLGAGGNELEARKIVLLSVTLEATGKSLLIPCYVVDSTRPLWKGAVRNCGLVLGTNAMVGFGIELVHTNGMTVQPVYRDSELVEPAKKNVTRVVLSGVTRIGPQETKFVRVNMVQSGGINEPPQVIANASGIVSPNEDILANVSCDFMKQLWTGESNVMIELNNWGTTPQTLVKGQEIGLIEPAMLVESEDPLWNDGEEDASVRVCHAEGSAERKVRLKKMLQIANNCSDEDRKQLESMLLEHNNVFALDDQELGETDMVTHSIDTGSAKPVQTLPRRLPYALRKELELELSTLLDTGCIEPCVSPYSSALLTS